MKPQSAQASNFTVRTLSVWGGSTQLLAEDLEAMLYNKWSALSSPAIGGSPGTWRRNMRARAQPACLLVEHPEEIERGTVVVTTGALSAGMEYPRHFSA